MNSFFNSRKNRKNQTRGLKDRNTLQRRQLGLESLEDRLLLTAVPYGWGILAVSETAYDDAGTAAVGLKIDRSNEGTVLIGLLVSPAQGSSADPGAITIRDSSGLDITEGTVLKSTLNYSGKSSLVLLELNAGEYEIGLQSEKETTGTIDCTIFLPGDVNGNGEIDTGEFQMANVYASAERISLSGTASLGTIEYYETKYGIDLTDIDSAYNPEYDVTMNGTVNASDLSFLQQNKAGTISVNFFELFKLTEINQEFGALEGDTGKSAESEALAPDSFSAKIQSDFYQSNGYTITRFVQTGISISSGTETAADLSHLVSFGADGRFTFNAADSSLDSLAEGETLSLTIDYYLDDLTFDGIENVYQNVKGGTLSITVFGKNSAPQGAGDSWEFYSLETRTFSEPVNLIARVIDPEGDPLSPSLISAQIGENSYGIPTGIDYSAYFSVSETGDFSADGEGLAALLTAVPNGEPVIFTICYNVSDLYGAFCTGTLFLTVLGQNDAPIGAADYSAVCSLPNRSFSPEINLLNGVTDPDGDILSVQLGSIVPGENDYGIIPEIDYSSCFILNADGTFGVNYDRMTEMLKTVPAGGTVLFTIDYSVYDTDGAADSGKIEVTVNGQNDAPETIVNPLDLTEEIKSSSLIYTVCLTDNLTDPDGDSLSVSKIALNDQWYDAEKVNGIVQNGLVYRFNTADGVLTITASDSLLESLKWNYNAESDLPQIDSFSYCGTDENGAAVVGDARLFFLPADDPAEISSAVSGGTFVRKSNPSETDQTHLGTALFNADRTGYAVSVVLTDAEGKMVNTDDAADLITVTIKETGAGGNVSFALNDYAAQILESDCTYTVSWTLSLNGTEDAASSFWFELKDLEVNQFSDAIGVQEGETGKTQTQLPQNYYSAVIDGETRISESFTIGTVRQTSSSRTGDYSSCLTFSVEDGYFTFNAGDEIFSALKEGEEASFVFEFTLNNLVMSGSERAYNGIKGGTVSVTVTGKNSAPKGAADYAESYSIETGTLSESINLTAGVTDPEGDPLTPSLISAILGANQYGIPTDVDYTDHFSVSETGVFSADREKLRTLLAAVPAGETVTFTVTYNVADTDGAFCSGTVLLTVIGQNDAPVGAEDYSASCLLSDRSFFPEINLLQGVTDPDGDKLGIRFDSIVPSENEYGITPEVDYSSCFIVGTNGGFGVDFDKAAVMLKSIPADGTVVFTIGYSVYDIYGASDSGKITVTVYGENNEPEPVAEPLDLNEEIESRTLVYTVSLAENMTDPDGDQLSVSKIKLNGTIYEAEEVSGIEQNGLIYNFNSAAGVLTITASDSLIESLKWEYRAESGRQLIDSFEYYVEDSFSAETSGSVRLFFDPADDPAEIKRAVSDGTFVRKSDPGETDQTHLGTAAFSADRTGYRVAVTVTNPDGDPVNIGDAAGLVTVSIEETGTGGTVSFLLSDLLAEQLENETLYTVTWTLWNDDLQETASSFRFELKELAINQFDDSISVTEGETGSGSQLQQNYYHAVIEDVEYISKSFTVGAISQVSSNANDYSSCLTYNAETGCFIFDADDDLFAYLGEGEVEELAFEFTLNDLVMGDYPRIFNGIKGGTVQVTVTGVNSKPQGVTERSTVYDLTAAEFEPELNLLDGVSDPEGDLLTVSITAGTLEENEYGISSGNYYTSYFSVNDGVFSLDKAGLSEILKAVPQGGSVEFTVTYQVSDSNGASVSSLVHLTVNGKNELPVCEAALEASYDIADAVLVPSVNILDGASDPDYGEVLTPALSSARIGANPYGIPAEADYLAYFAVDAAGNFSVDDAALAELLKYVPDGETVTFTIGYTVTDSCGAEASGGLTLTVTGNYEAPKFIKKIDDITGQLADNSGYGSVITLDLSEYFSGTVAGYNVSLSGESDILNEERPYILDGSNLTLCFAGTAAYKTDMNVSDLGLTVTAYDGHGLEAVSNTASVSLTDGKTVTISLACVTEEYGGADVTTLKTGSSNFGTFYYLNAGDVPKTDYEAIAKADSYYLEVWISDTSYFLTGKSQFMNSIQIQLNYETDGTGITSLTLEDFYAGKVSLDEYLYYDEGETMLKAVQAGWLFGEGAKWDLMEPITNGENAFLLARFVVNAKTASSISVSGVDTEVSPFVEGYYYTRTGENDSVNDSQIQTVDVKTAKTTPIQGAADAEYVVDNGVYLRTVTEASASEKRDEIGTNADFIHEWQSHYTEIWVKTSKTDPLTAVSTDLNFDESYFTVAGLEFGESFKDGNWTWNAGTGTISLSAAAENAVSDGAYILLARIRYEAASSSTIAWSESLTPVTLNWGLSETVVTTLAGARNAYIGLNAVTDLWVNPYDVNDDGAVNIADFTIFANNYGGNSTENHVRAFFDFNRDGTIDLRDFTAFAGVYGASRESVASGEVQLAFPETFTRRYLGSTLDADNTDLVGKICDQAADDWSNALGTDENLNVVIVVKDLADGRLASAQITETDPVTGLPVSGTIYLDDDAAGNRWSAQMTAPEADSTRYDLYSVILHELGHLYGYDAESSNYAAVAAKLDWLDAEGHSTDSADVMYSVLDPGTRKTLTIHDITAAAALQCAADEVFESADSAEIFFEDSEFDFEFIDRMF